MKTLKPSLQGLVQLQPDHYDWRPKPKSINIPTIFDDGEAYDSPLLTPEYGSHKFWATEDVTEASKLDATLHDLTARLSKLYIPERNDTQGLMKPFDFVVMQTSSVRDVGPSDEDLRDVSTLSSVTPLASSSPIERHSEDEASQRRRPYCTTVNEGLKRTWSVFKGEDNDDDGHEPTQTTSSPQATSMKRTKIVSAATDLRVSNVSDLQTPTFASSKPLPNDRSVVGKAPAALAFGNYDLPTGSTPLKRKRNLLPGDSSSTCSQRDCIKSRGVEEKLFAKIKRARIDCPWFPSQPPWPLRTNGTGLQEQEREDYDVLADIYGV